MAREEAERAKNFGIVERILRSLLNISIFLITVVLCFIANLIQLALLPVSLSSVRVRHYSNSFLAGGLWYMCNMIFWVSGGELKVFGAEELKSGESAMVILNHRSFADFFLLHTVAIRHGMIWFCRYFAKDSVKWIPFFGWGIRLMGMILLKRNWLQDQKRILGTFAFYTKHKVPLWLVSYSEGSRYSPSKLQDCREYALLHGRKPPKYVLLPRTRGFVASVQALKNVVSAVYDVTLVYYSRDGKHRVPSPCDYILANLSGFVFEIHLSRHPISELPMEDEKELGEWLHDRFQAKDILLQKRYEAIESQIK